MTITLTTSNPTVREVIDDAKANALIETWKEQLKNETASGDNSVLCEKIVLDGKSYTPEAAEVISNFLTSTTDFEPSIASGVKVAILSDIIASQPEDKALKVLQTISDAFKNSRLEEVDLSDNAMGTKGVVACHSVLRGPTVSDTLQKLKLCNNGLSQYTMEEVAILLTEGESECIAKHLTQIHFFNNMSDDDGCVSFKKILSRAANLEDIRFSGTRAKARGSVHIAEGLNDLASSGRLSGIKRLDLADNSFGDCYQLLADALRQCSKLEYLDLHDCLLDDDGIVAVCDALLEAKPPLSFLSLSGNNIGSSSDAGGKSVAALINSINTSIVTFNASENELKSPGIRRIARAFKSDSVKKISLNENEIGTVGAKEVIKMSSRVPNLEVLELDCNGFLPDVVDSLDETFGEKLQEMEDNIDDEDYDDELDPEDLKEDEIVTSESDQAGNRSDADVDALAEDFSKLGQA